MSRSTPILQRISDSFFRHIILFIVVVFLVSAITIVAITSRSKQYVASAQTEVLPDEVQEALGQTDKSEYITPAQQNVNHFKDLINDDLPGGFFDTAMKRANLSAPIDLDPRDNDPHYEQLKKHLDAAPESDNVFTITLTWDNRSDCEKIVQALQQQYIEEVGLDRSAQSIHTGELLDSQIREYEKRMQVAEQALIKYKENNSGQLPEQQTADIGQLASLQTQLDNLKITAQGATLTRQNLENQLAHISPLDIREQTAVESPYMVKIRDLEAERDAKVAGGMLPTHPQVVALDTQIATLKRELPAKIAAGDSAATGILQTKRQDNPLYQSLQMQLIQARNAENEQTSQMSNLEQEIASYKKVIQKIPEEQRELTDKTRDYTVLTAQYNALKERREEVRIKGDLDKVSASSTLSRIGWIYAQPVTTRGKLILLIAGSVLLGLIVGALMIVLYEWGDSSLRYPLDSEKLLGVPVLAVLPESADLHFHTKPSSLSGGGKKLLSAPADKKAKPVIGAPSAVAPVMNTSSTEQ